MAFLSNMNECPDSRMSWRIVDVDDLFVSPRIFRLLDLEWGLTLLIVLVTNITICFLD